MNNEDSEHVEISNFSSPKASSSTNVQVSFRKLQDLSTAQFTQTNTVFKKLWQYLRIVLLKKANPFEEYVLEAEPNDSALVAKYSGVTRVDLSRQQGLSVDEVYLKTLHIDHPLTNFMKNENNQSVDISQELKESPILVFVHGMGGQMSQFEPLMALLSQCSEIVSLDLPGFGDSRADFSTASARLTKISPEDQERISTSVASMADGDFTSNNISVIITEFINQTIPPNKKVVLIAHSMGCHLSVRVAKKLPSSKVEGLILLTSPGFQDDIYTNEQVKNSHKTSIFANWMTKFPSVVNLMRVWDRLEGLESSSVFRQIGDTSLYPPHTSLYIKLRQFRWNLDVDTKVILKYIKGFERCKYSDLVAAIKRFNNNPFDTRVYEKTVLVAGTDDKVTPPQKITEIDNMLSHVFQRKVSTLIEIKNAGHGLLLSKPEFISGKILDHIENKFPERLHLSPAWVLRVKADISGDKWGLKNELKWSRLDPISLNISRNHGKDISPLLGMKTLREGDANHSPIILENAFYGDRSMIPSQYKLPTGHLIAIVDISADIPPYDPETFKIITYYKCATVSKVVPDPGSIRKFIQLIDKILESKTIEDPLIAVHCHYGFNRTGFLICCFLIERLGWSVEEAIGGFRDAKPPGIKHRHFIDALYVRYES
ncbi:hypothetical protein CANTEDRAFT_126271 [Yamadazyma tenuis ATCC 10573]|uniref:Uncharacterized protein n=2 Tax=Candida tenuis (strain ATCC 10573 / BCRC 21748 / CBS 615 / JCM 9827 / NBRC 10315 / NRRL Y-1498 / VKM Y-70) TaxID=590646 RepID=G3B8G9_CANTC|nr:uncharacterized protein CANTEDRAFT_126271 [Yamadazyma tenuis ATCC 10573]EGV62391.1 hypothetical protein CANTEDRAFT_126271 [Yamadazyma tenuis ATCC 10573]